MDRGYVDFARLYRFVLAGAFFVTRAKAGLQINRLASRPVDESTGVRSDQVVWLKLSQSIMAHAILNGRDVTQIPADLSIVGPTL